ncbi:pyrimidine utilization protein D [Methylopila henanensis]|uniref:Putative carbamate hydrolase RutD n=1 Tax=Methylopila henanensis TaxID=873516 RepID=A0ABW4K335_9HYPH
MRYDVTGLTGPDAGVVVLSTGLGGFGAYWKPQLAALEQRYRVVVYDHRGAGANAGPLPDGYSIGHMADDVLDILDDGGFGPVHFVGHALGGLVGLDLALRRPDRLASLTLVNAWAKIASPTLRCFEARTALLRHAGVAAYVRAQAIFLYPAEWIAANEARLAADEAHAIEGFQGEDTLLRRIAALSAFDVSRRLSEVPTPTLVVAATDDVLVPWTASRDLAEGLPRGRLQLGTGGHASTVTEAAAFNSVLREFLDDL